MRPPILLAMLLTAAAGLTAGCGKSEDDQVRAVVERFADAGAKADYQRICDELITPALSQKVEAVGLPCEIAFKKGLEGVKNPRIVVRSVKVDGDKARVAVHSTATGEKPSDDVLQVVKIDGDWRIASLAGGGSG